LQYIESIKAPSETATLYRDTVLHVKEKTPTMTDLAAATRRYNHTAAKHEEARQDVIAAAVAALKAGDTPTEVAEQSPFTPAYVRRLAREHGIPPAPTGRKPKDRSAGA
jgi:hypothetical protein